ncbi:MAG TPA: 2-amino-4-hydroxy-6-hydroxymethyldihydropteridine diphosphokinase [Methylophilaceae bacterium]|nr:2-amino-4-hydroxy-6-hydroxymethyldihydropteridine diphosphokinase [Methylophilaceae bacterium]
MQNAFIALGSNLQQPEQQILQAFSEIKSLPKTRLVKCSSLYRTAPVGYDNQPDFINAVVEVQTDLTPRELLRALLAVENKHGRERPFPNAPRVLDLDLLLYGNMVMTTDELTLPHPRMHERGFVLLPLAEIAPTLQLTRYGKVSELAKTHLAQGVEKLAAN